MLDESEDETLIRSILSKTGTAGSPAARRQREPEKLAWTLPGFHGKARVHTSFGHLPVEALRPRDPVLTKSGEFLMVEWVDRIELDAGFLALHPLAYPVLVPAGSVGSQLPGQDLLLSTAQMLHLPGRTQSGGACTAACLVGRQRIRRQAVSAITYYIFHCGRPATVCVDGLWCDTSPD